MARSRRSDVEAAPKPASDSYTGMLIVSLVAMILGCVFLYLDYSQYPSGKPTIPAMGK
jgi:hypothetical protein